MSEELNSKYHPVPQPDDITQTEKEDAMGSYLMMFAAFAVGLPLPIINLIAAIVYYILNRRKSRFVKFHSLQSLLSQIPTTIMNAVLVGWTIRLFIVEKFDNVVTDVDWSATNAYIGYAIAVAVANLMYVIFSIVAAVKANKGQFYYFIFFGKVAYHYAFSKSVELNPAVVNKPPTL
jgi:uncharacterized Tic20 family protein